MVLVGQHVRALAAGTAALLATDLYRFLLARREDPGDLCQQTLRQGAYDGAINTLQKESCSPARGHSGRRARVEFPTEMVTMTPAEVPLTILFLAHFLPCRTGR